MTEGVEDNVEKLLASSPLARRVFLWAGISVMSIMGTAGYLAMSWGIQWMQNQWAAEQGRLLSMETRLGELRSQFVTIDASTQQRQRRDQELADIRAELARQQARIDRLAELIRGGDR